MTFLYYFAVLFEFWFLIFFITGFIGSCLITVILDGFKVDTVSWEEFHFFALSSTAHYCWTILHILLDIASIDLREKKDILDPECHIQKWTEVFLMQLVNELVTSKTLYKAIAVYLQ